MIQGTSIIRNWQFNLERKEAAQLSSKKILERWNGNLKRRWILQIYSFKIRSKMHPENTKIARLFWIVSERPLKWLLPLRGTWTLENSWAFIFRSLEFASGFAHQQLLFYHADLRSKGGFKGPWKLAQKCFNRNSVSPADEHPPRAIREAQSVNVAFLIRRFRGATNCIPKFFRSI